MTAQLDSPHSIDSPSPRPVSRSKQTPMALTSKLRAPNTSTLSLSLSPAQDDKSIVDPERSSLPISMSRNTLATVLTPKADVGDDENGKEAESPIAKRQQSLSELKEAFTRMRDLSGVDRSSMAGSRRTSAAEDAAIEPEQDQKIWTDAKARQAP